jgi:hypothetical protein
MADDRDSKLSQRYRELDDEAPPRKLDEAILAAARRVAGRRRRWYLAMGAATVLVLALAVTVHLERIRPDPESVDAPPAPAHEARDAASLERRAADAAEPNRAEQAQPATAARAAPPLTPERWLERIVQLRKEGQHEEADKQLAEFRRTYPEYTVSEAALR